MAYKDPEKQRAYLRAYQRAWRAKKRLDKSYVEKQRAYEMARSKQPSYIDSRRARDKKRNEKRRKNPAYLIQKHEGRKTLFAKLHANESFWIRRACQRLKSKAVAKGIAFDITPADLTIPAVCPFTLKPFIFGKGSRGLFAQSPSVDRIKPDKGYVRGNVRIISGLANMAKSNITDPAIFDRLAEDARLWGLV
jgi:hypothetical protein